MRVFFYIKQNLLGVKKLMRAWNNESNSVFQWQKKNLLGILFLQHHMLKTDLDKHWNKIKQSISIKFV